MPKATHVPVSGGQILRGGGRGPPPVSLEGAAAPVTEDSHVQDDVYQKDENPDRHFGVKSTPQGRAMGQQVVRDEGAGIGGEPATGPERVFQGGERTGPALEVDQRAPEEDGQLHPHQPRPPPQEKRAQHHHRDEEEVQKDNGADGEVEGHESRGVP
jgi:hypothetical protein